MGLGEAGGGSAPQPLFEHVEGFGRALGARSEQTPLTDPALLTEQALPDQSILGGLVAAQAVTLADLSASGVALFFVATLVQPLVFAHVNGFEVLGAELPIAVARSTPMRLLEYVPSAVSSTFHACCAFRFGSGRGVEHRNGVYDCVD
jgi:hypothetical protein